MHVGWPGLNSDWATVLTHKQNPQSYINQMTEYQIKTLRLWTSPSTVLVPRSADPYWQHVSLITTELTLTIWRTSSPSSSWELSTPWLDLHWPWPACTSWFSSLAVCCTASPTCCLCEHRLGLWRTRSHRSPASPWLCRSWWQPWRTPKYPPVRDAVPKRAPGRNT